MLRREALPLYGPQLADALASGSGEAMVTLWPNHWQIDVAGEEIAVSWPAFFDVLRTRRPFRGAFNHPGFAMATFAPSLRVLANVRAVSALVLVFGRDRGVDLDAFATAWSHREGIVFTMNEHSASAHAFVAVLPYTRLVSATEHRSAVTALGAYASRNGLPFDPGARNPARFVRLPGTVPGMPFETRTLEGRPINAQ